MTLHTGKNIYITGFMATGKSTVGRLLARKLARSFIDSDRDIENKTKMSIKDIFDSQGEAHFRKLESELICNLDQSHNLVVSLGGGSVLDSKNQAIIKKGVWIYLDTPLDVIHERLSRTSHRPLAKKSQSEIENLYQERLPIYKNATLIIPCANHSPDTICQLILKRILEL